MFRSVFNAKHISRYVLIPLLCNEIPPDYKLKMRINFMDSNANSNKFVPPPKFEDVEKAATKAGFNFKITFPEEGLAGVTKFYKYDPYEEQSNEKSAPWIVERECLDIGGVLPQFHKLSELYLIREVQGITTIHNPIKRDFSHNIKNVADLGNLAPF